MKSIQYSIVDVFAQRKYTGNQLAVFKDAGSLSDKEMQQMAKEINFSETTFITSASPQKGEYDVRIFTPTEEVPFAGHPTLGTAYVIREELEEKDTEELTLHYKAGPTPVTYDEQKDVLWMTQGQPTFGKVLDKKQVADVLNLDEAYIDMRFPVQEVSTGLPVILVPLTSLEAAKEINVDKEKYFKLIENTEAKAIMVFSPETYHEDHHVNARDFADYYGVPEDAATGSANGCLAAYLVKYGYFNQQAIDICVEQGYEIGRPSLLYVKASYDGEIFHIKVGGKVEMIARGEWIL
ncbi:MULTISPECIES: PhzF family phenazine biosynthesis protein [Priestia]|uniref:PhzF family phenazine biosynthesis protein n=1 Tax=Priestia TaxID=2800373 RepID=UPI000E115E9B|nr:MULTISPECIES: PhzF family phenazine biosynthesis protein [Priestia]SUV09208.1 phenazine biosynthesis protein [Priestia megaterium]